MRTTIVFLLLLSYSLAISPLLVAGGIISSTILASMLKVDEVLGNIMGNTLLWTLNQMTGVCSANNISIASSGIGLAYIAVVGVFLFMLVIHMIEKTLFNTSRIPILLKVEDAVVTILIIAFFHLFYSLFGGANNYFLEQSLEYADKGILILTDSYAKMIFANFVFATLFNLDVPLLQRGGLITLSINTGFVSKPLTDSVMLLANMLQASAGEWIVRKLTLCLTPLLVLYYLFPLGALLRALYFTRGAGSAMLALSFSLMFFYPLLNFISYEIFKATNSVINSFNVSPTAQEMADLAKYLILTMGVVWAITTTFSYLINIFPQMAQSIGISIKGAVQATLSLPTRLLSQLYYLALVGFLIGLIMGYIPQLLKDLFIFIVGYGLVLPAINIYLTLVLAMELSKIFGMQVDLSAFMRLI